MRAFNFTPFIYALPISFCLIQSSLLHSANGVSGIKQPVLTQSFKDYWYSGKAEITSYNLKQSRYGELHEGTAVHIFVTEPFLPNEQVKADIDHADNLSVLKLNTSYSFLTGIYPYSISSSTFFPISSFVNIDSHALKVSASTQEWCGHTYSQINNRGDYNVKSHSYFEGEADQAFTLQQQHLENEIWTKIRLSPSSLPIGDTQMVPSLIFTRLRHHKIKAYNVTASLSKKHHNDKNTEASKSDFIYTYTLNYPSLSRTLNIDFNSEFPYEILGWRETQKSGFGDNVKMLTSVAVKKSTIKSDYWHKHTNKDRSLRQSLGL